MTFRKRHNRTRPRGGSCWRRRARVSWLWAVAVLLTAGCSLRDDPHHNRFAPARDQPRVLQRADGLVTSAEQALDNAEQRIDNIID